MTLDKSLKVKRGANRNRSVMTRVERLERLKEADRWKEGDSPLGLPKVRVRKMMIKKKKKKKEEEGAEGAAAPAAGAAAPAAAKTGRKASRQAGCQEVSRQPAQSASRPAGSVANSTSVPLAPDRRGTDPARPANASNRYPGRSDSHAASAAGNRPTPASNT